MKKFILFITIVASAILANAYDYDSLSDRVDKLERENKNRKRDAQMRSLGRMITIDKIYHLTQVFNPFAQMDLIQISSWN